jgi:hypothetical protein
MIEKAHAVQQDFYEIKVKGHLDSYWSEWFDALTVTHERVATRFSPARSLTKPRCTVCWPKYATWAYPYSP